MTRNREFPLVYLAGPIANKTDAECMGWRLEAAELLAEKNIGVRDPMVRDYRGRVEIDPAIIVGGDLEDIKACELVIVNCLFGPSWGTAMELPYAKQLGKPVIAIVPSGINHSPWLMFHSKVMVVSLTAACNWAYRLLHTSGTLPAYAPGAEGS